MKRTRLRRKSVKNSNPHEDLAARAAYMATVTKCEIIHLFPGSKLFAQIPMGSIIHRVSREALASDPHHVCGGANGAARDDCLSNLTVICRPAHEWCERYRIDQFWLCARAKLDKVQFEPREINRVLGLIRPNASCVGYFDRKPLVFDWVAPIKESVMRDVELMMEND